MTVADKIALVGAYQAVFSSPEGQRVLAHLEGDCFIHTPTYVQGDPTTTILNEGSRRVILSIKRLLNTDIKQLQLQAQIHEQTPQADL